jgi:hypothetical protein
VAVSSEVATILKQIGEGIQKVTQLVGEVSAASDEQAKGVEQVNTAVAQMDKVTQSNAASAEESASAGEELSAQARELQEHVNVLVGMVRGDGGSGAEHAVVTSTAPLRDRKPSVGLQNCWEVKNCGRTPGGAKAKDLGICPAYPSHGRDCWAVAGTLCGGKIQGSFASKIGNCQKCEFYLSCASGRGSRQSHGAAVQGNGGNGHGRKAMTILRDSRPQSRIAGAVDQARAAKPSQVIPLDDEELKEF